MFLVREVMHCKPGQVQPLVNKFKELGRVMSEKGFPAAPRILTDVSGERFWTLISEQEVDNLEKYAELTRQTMSDPQIKTIMDGYHDLVESGHREIYRIEK